jgi:hypothetical protein
MAELVVGGRRYLTIRHDGTVHAVPSVDGHAWARSALCGLPRRRHPATPHDSVSCPDCHGRIATRPADLDRLASALVDAVERYGLAECRSVPPTRRAELRTAVAAHAAHRGHHVRTTWSERFGIIAHAHGVDPTAVRTVRRRLLDGHTRVQVPFRFHWGDWFGS